MLTFLWAVGETCRRAFRALAQSERFDLGWPLLAGTYPYAVSLAENIISLADRRPRRPVSMGATPRPMSSPAQPEPVTLVDSGQSADALLVGCLASDVPSGIREELFDDKALGIP